MAGYVYNDIGIYHFRLKNLRFDLVSHDVDDNDQHILRNGLACGGVVYRDCSGATHPFCNM